jgi:hypothetical protein
MNPKPKIERVEAEFYCTECRQYFLTYLRSNMNGNYTIECPFDGDDKRPRCRHHHFRTITDGVITSSRWAHSFDREKAESPKEIIVGLASTLSPAPRVEDPDFKRRLLKRVVPLNT